MVMVLGICIYDLVSTSFWCRCRGLDNISVVMVSGICIYNLVSIEIDVVVFFRAPGR